MFHDSHVPHPVWDSDCHSGARKTKNIGVTLFINLFDAIQMNCTFWVSADGALLTSQNLPPSCIEYAYEVLWQGKHARNGRCLYDRGSTTAHQEITLKSVLTVFGETKFFVGQEPPARRPGIVADDDPAKYLLRVAERLFARGGKLTGKECPGTHGMNTCNFPIILGMRYCTQCEATIQYQAWTWMRFPATPPAPQGCPPGKA